MSETNFSTDFRPLTVGTPASSVDGPNSVDSDNASGNSDPLDGEGILAAKVDVPDSF
jgi:hypothetical protein